MTTDIIKEIYEEIYSKNKGTFLKYNMNKDILSHIKYIDDTNLRFKNKFDKMNKILTKSRHDYKLKQELKLFPPDKYLFMAKFKPKIKRNVTGKDITNKIEFISDYIKLNTPIIIAYNKRFYKISGSNYKENVLGNVPILEKK